MNVFHHDLAHKKNFLQHVYFADKIFNKVFVQFRQKAAKKTRTVIFLIMSLVLCRLSLAIKSIFFYSQLLLPFFCTILNIVVFNRENHEAIFLFSVDCEFYETHFEFFKIFLTYFENSKGVF
jgi:hypothetical protein